MQARINNVFSHHISILSFRVRILSPYSYRLKFRELVQSERITFRAALSLVKAVLSFCSESDTFLTNYTIPNFTSIASLLFSFFENTGMKTKCKATQNFKFVRLGCLLRDEKRKKQPRRLWQSLSGCL